jgi:type I restriction enzyme, R subunit
MHTAMKQLLPGAMFIGFTGTPLLKTDKQTSIETFGSFIHTYKFDEAVADGVVLDLRYEARTSTRTSPPSQSRQWFEAKTKGMTDLAEGSAEEALGHHAESGQLRAARQADRQRHPDRHGDQTPADGRARQRHAGGPSIYQACKFYELLLPGLAKASAPSSPATNPRPATSPRKTPARVPPRSFASTRSTGRCWPTTSTSRPTGRNKVELFEKQVKERFIDTPGQMRLLIVVDKLLTGFDAPSATYLYIDKKMQDHGLFQAICRVNRLDGDDKDYGYIVDYRGPVQLPGRAITDYTSGALDGYDKKTSKDCCPTGSTRPAKISTRRWRRSAPSANRSSHPRTPSSTRSTSARPSRQRRAAQSQRAKASRAVQGRRSPRPLPTATSPTR